MTTYTVTAPLVIVRDTDGASHHVYQGGVIGSGFDGEHVKQLLEGGMIAKSDAPDPGADDTDGEPVTFDGPPAKSADKATWEAYAIHRGFTAEEIDGLKKPELVTLATDGTPGAATGEPPSDPEDEDAGDGDAS